MRRVRGESVFVVIVINRSRFSCRERGNGRRYFFLTMEVTGISTSFLGWLLLCMGFSAALSCSCRRVVLRCTEFRGYRGERDFFHFLQEECGGARREVETVRMGVGTAMQLYRILWKRERSESTTSVPLRMTHFSNSSKTCDSVSSLELGLMSLLSRIVNMFLEIARGSQEEFIIRIEERKSRVFSSFRSKLVM